MEEDKSQASSIVAYVMLALIALVLVAAVVPDLHKVTILVAAIIWPALGTMLAIGIMVTGALAAMGRQKSTENFSSFAAHEEKSFVVFERTMNDNASSASTMAIIASGLLGVVMVAIVLIFASPHPVTPPGAAPAAAEKH